METKKENENANKRRLARTLLVCLLDDSLCNIDNDILSREDGIILNASVQNTPGAI